MLHLNEVKNTPNAFVSKLKEGAKKKDGGQFKRYADWMQEGNKKGQIRQARVYIRNSEPKFHEIIDERVLTILSENIAKDDTTETILQIKNTKFSFDELQNFYQDAKRKLGELIKQEKKSNPNVDVGKLIGSLLNQHFDSMEQAFETLGKTYGH